MKAKSGLRSTLCELTAAFVNHHQYNDAANCLTETSGNEIQRCEFSSCVAGTTTARPAAVSIDSFNDCRLSGNSQARPVVLGLAVIIPRQRLASTT